jgi:hypothetical protein
MGVVDGCRKEGRDLPLGVFPAAFFRNPPFTINHFPTLGCAEKKSGEFAK